MRIYVLLRVLGAYADEALAQRIKADTDKALETSVARGDDVVEVCGVDVEGLSS